MADEDGKMSEEEMQKLLQLIGTAPIPEEKQSVYTFLTKVAESDDTTKLGFLTEEELGMPKLPLRTEKELALFCEMIGGMPYFAKYFDREGEILTATSLSKNAKLLTLAVVQKREIADVTKRKHRNKGWFRKDKPEAEDG